MIKIKGIFFDMGSTLIEFENSTWKVLGQRSAEKSYNFLKDRGLIKLDFNLYSALLKNLFSSAFELSEQTLEEFRFEDLAKDIFKKLNLGLQDGDYTGFLKTYYQPITEQVTLIEGAVEILDYFKEKGYKLGLISNTIFPAKFHLEELKRFGLYPHFDSISFSSEAGYKKPHPFIFRQGLDRLEIEAKESIFIGDKLIEDIGGAKNIGMKAILKFKEGRDYSAPVIPDGIIRNLSELREMVDRIKHESFKNKEKI
jgi:putative hydrolase of the HAD superfamily